MTKYKQNIKSVGSGERARDNLDGTVIRGMFAKRLKIKRSAFMHETRCNTEQVFTLWSLVFFWFGRFVA